MPSEIEQKFRVVNALPARSGNERMCPAVVRILTARDIGQ